MATLTCDICAGRIIIGAGGIASCEKCGVGISKERLQERMSEHQSAEQEFQSAPTERSDAHGWLITNILPILLLVLIGGGFAIWAIRGSQPDCAKIVKNWQLNAHMSGQQIVQGIEYMKVLNYTEARILFEQARQTLEKDAVPTCFAKSLKAHQLTLRAIASLVSATQSFSAGQNDAATKHLDDALVFLTESRPLSKLRP
jgi:hypothetical protein